MSDLDLVCRMRAIARYYARQVINARIAELEAAQEKDDLLSREKTKVIVTELEAENANLRLK